jgi:GSH-dependent disulfide-bond oxidoreductase
MIDLYYWPTANGHKVTICLEETGLDYRVIKTDINRGEQFDPAFANLNPNAKIPVIVDHDPADKGPPVVQFESGAILYYLCQKSGRFLPGDARAQYDVMTWVFWQASGFGPMLGQAHHFNRKAPSGEAYARERYNAEALRLYGVLDRRLAGRDHIADTYGIADMMTLPWVRRYAWQNIDLGAFPNVKSWHDRVLMRPAVARAYALAEPPS